MHEITQLAEFAVPSLSNAWKDDEDFTPLHNEATAVEVTFRTDSDEETEEGTVMVGTKFQNRSQFLESLEASSLATAKDFTLTDVFAYKFDSKNDKFTQESAIDKFADEFIGEIKNRGLTSLKCLQYSGLRLRDRRRRVGPWKKITSEFTMDDVTYYPKGQLETNNFSFYPNAFATMTREDSKVSIFFLARGKEVIVTATYSPISAQNSEVQEPNREKLKKIFDQLKRTEPQPMFP
eukprot:GHVP01024137.1.p1 GENE.GHVP01024137.1~~GHVP01024137.1.p1  ORF type:complete len:250 (-),score=36.17 GHVP01024137.1:261-968(-)